MCCARKRTARKTIQSQTRRFTRKENIVAAAELLIRQSAAPNGGWRRGAALLAPQAKIVAVIDASSSPELRFTRLVQRGDQGRDVKLAQEWLCHHGYSLAVDAQFGIATKTSLRRFQANHGLAESGTVDKPTQAALLAPITAAAAPLEPGNQPLGALVVAYARQHLAQHPIEIGGENAGPWVRFYMNGHEGRQWPWCAGFATYVLRQAARTLGVTSSHPYAFGCDYLAGVAQANGLLFAPSSRANLALLQPGCLFLVRRGPNHWAHIGIVEALEGETMLTIEGNTNDSGSAEGFEVCRRTRTIREKDYLLVR